MMSDFSSVMQKLGASDEAVKGLAHYGITNLEQFLDADDDEVKPKTDKRMAEIRDRLNDDIANIMENDYSLNYVLKHVTKFKLPATVKTDAAPFVESTDRQQQAVSIKNSDGVKISESIPVQATHETSTTVELVEN